MQFISADLGASGAVGLAAVGRLWKTNTKHQADQFYGLWLGLGPCGRWRQKWHYAKFRDGHKVISHHDLTMIGNIHGIPITPPALHHCLYLQVWVLWIRWAGISRMAPLWGDLVFWKKKKIEIWYAQAAQSGLLFLGPDHSMRKLLRNM